MRAALVALILLTASQVVAAGRHDAEARDIYHQGEVAYRAGDFETAYGDFKRAYFLSPTPALLFNMASAAKELNRPGDAAEHLRAYLRTVPDAPQRPDIEQRIRSLVEAQTMLDADRARSAPKPTPAPEPVAPPPAVTSAPVAAAITAPPPAPPPNHKKAWIIGGTIGGVVVVAAVALGLAFGLHKTQSLTPGSLSNVQATP